MHQRIGFAGNRAGPISAPKTRPPAGSTPAGGSSLGCHARLRVAAGEPLLLLACMQAARRERPESLPSEERPRSPWTMNAQQHDTNARRRSGHHRRPTRVRDHTGPASGRARTIFMLLPVNTPNAPCARAYQTMQENTPMSPRRKRRTPRRPTVGRILTFVGPDLVIFGRSGGFPGRSPRPCPAPSRATPGCGVYAEPVIARG